MPILYLKQTLLILKPQMRRMIS